MIDDLDLKLIRQLQKNGRQSYVDLAKSLGVVEGTVRQRLNHLLAKGIIQISAVPNLHELGYGFISAMALQVNMTNLKIVAETLARNPRVCYLAFITGRYDLLAIVATRSPEELSEFIKNQVSAIPGVLRTETFVNLDIIKGSGGSLDTLQLISIGLVSPKKDKEVENHTN